MSTFLYNDPFWSFFDNINEEVNNFNNILGNRQRNRPRQIANSSNKNNNAKTTEVAAPKSNPVRSLKPWYEPFFNDSLFDFGFNENSNFVPPVDIVNKDKTYDLHVSVPGAPKDNITIDFNSEDNELVIKGTIPSVKPEEKEAKGSESDSENQEHHIERASGSFERRISLPVKVDGEHIKATFENGVLKLEVPKIENKEENKYKRIAISSSESYSS